MTTTSIREKLIREIQRIPDQNLRELYDFLHYYRLGLKRGRAKSKNNLSFTMSFAGCWKNMAAGEYETLLGDIQERRQKAFAGREIREALFD